MAEVVQIRACVPDDAVLHLRVHRRQRGGDAGQNDRIRDRDADPGQPSHKTTQHLTDHYASAVSSSSSSSAGNSLRVFTRYIARSAGTPSCLGENTCFRIRLADNPSAAKSSCEILSIVACVTISPPLVAFSITRAAMLTSTPNQSDPMRCGRPVCTPARIRGV